MLSRCRYLQTIEICALEISSEASAWCKLRYLGLDAGGWITVVSVVGPTISGSGRSVSSNERTLYACQTAISHACTCKRTDCWLIELTASANDAALLQPPGTTACLLHRTSQQ